MVLDLWLPDTTGFEILEWMNESERLADIPVIVFTSSTNPEYIERAYALGVCHCMQKPPNFGDLVEAVKEEIAEMSEPTSGSAAG